MSGLKGAHARTHARTHTHTNAHTHTRTHARARARAYQGRLFFVLLSLVFVLLPGPCFTLPRLCFIPWPLLYSLVFVLLSLFFALLSLVFVLLPGLCFTLPGLCFTPWYLFYSTFQCYFHGAAFDCCVHSNRSHQDHNSNPSFWITLDKCLIITAALHPQPSMKTHTLIDTGIRSGKTDIVIAKFSLLPVWEKTMESKNKTNADLIAILRKDDKTSK